MRLHMQKAIHIREKGKFYDGSLTGNEAENMES